MTKQKRIQKELKKTEDLEVKQRLLMIQEYYQGKTFREIGGIYACAFNLVKYWKDRYDKEGIKGLKTKQRSGRPKKIGSDKYQEIKQEIIEASKLQGWETRQIREYIHKQAGKWYSSRQITRIAQDWGLSLKVPRPIYAYTDEKERQKFLKKIVNS